MKITANIEYANQRWSADLKKPLDISIPLKAGFETVNCFYAPLMETFPVIVGDFIGSTQQGGILNFLNVKFNPHGNGTHTECVGHISKEKYTINQSLKDFHFFGKLVSLYPFKLDNGDRVITKQLVQNILNKNEVEALIIRTMPNDRLKLKMNYSGSNPSYFSPEAIEYIKNCGVQHLLVDLPSVDREEDGGKLAAHKAFWSYPNAPKVQNTITELIFVDNQIKDGYYLVNIQIASFEIDVSPSKPILYKLEQIL